MFSIKTMISFKGATININALSDAHGMLVNCPANYQIFVDNKEKMFVPTGSDEGKGKRNLFMVSGDWFMSGNDRNYLTNPKFYAQDVQLGFFNKFVKGLRRLADDETMKAFFTIGNHDLDAGVKMLDKSIKNLDATTVVTNLRLESSPGVKESKKAGKLVERHIVEIEDDKVDDKKHRVLILGLSPVNMDRYYKAGADLDFIDNSDKPQADLEEKDFKKTIKAFDKEIEAFKQERKQKKIVGTDVVVIMTHTGAGVAEALMRKNPDINLILDGHEHKDEEIKFSDGRKLIKLSEEFKKIENVKIIIDDKGKVKIENEKYSADIERTHENAMCVHALKTLKEDFRQRYKIETDCPEIEYLGKDGVRHKNSHLANYVTDVILSEIQKINSDVDIFGMAATSFRFGLPVVRPELPGRMANNFELISVLNGIEESVADIYVSEITGRELVQIILENLRFNAKNIETNPLVQYSGLVIDKKLLEEAKKGESIEELAKYVLFEKTGKKVDLDHAYKVANTKKWFIKSEYSGIKELNENKKKLEGANARKLFIGYFKKLENKEIKEQIKAGGKVRIIDTLA